MHELASYVSFSQPGRNIIHAVLVHLPSNMEPAKPAGAEKALWVRYLKRQHGCYDTDVVHAIDGSLLTEFAVKHLSCSLTVSVPKELFAPTPPEWERRWVNHWFAGPPKDQCEYRKRRIVAYGVQPPLLLLWFSVHYLYYGSGALLNLLVGYFGLNWAKFRPGNITDSDEWLRDRVGYFAKEAPWLIPLTPVIPLGAAGITAGTMLLLKAPFNPWLPWLVALMVVLGLWAVAVVLIGFFMAFSFFISTLENVFTAWGRKRREARRNAAARRLAPPVARPTAPPLYVARSLALACDSVGPTPMVIPKEYQTLHYRIQALKARVCRPFAW